MTRTIGGALSTDALARLHFNTLSHAERCAAIRRLSVCGQTDTTIAAATGLSVEMIRLILADQERA